MIEIRAAQKEDVPVVMKTAKYFYKSEKDLEQRLLESVGTSFVIKDSLGRIGIMFGYSQPWQGVLEIWSVTTISFDYSKKSYHRFAKEKIEEVFETLPGIHRMQIYVKAKYPHLQRWAEGLGFTYEGRHPMMGPDKEEYLSFGRVK